MKKLELIQMESTSGGKLCSAQGYTVAALAGTAMGGPIVGLSLYLGAWIGCSL